MKKTLKVFALTALAFTMIFTSCKKDVKPNIDVVQVEASKITVEAYPCENRISWTPVSNADYALYRNGSKVDIDANKTFIYVDTNIVDGVEYEYKIITTPKKDFEIKNEFGDQVTALGGSNKTAYYTKGNSASAKVTAIVPATTITSKDGVTTAITAVDLIDFDKKAKKTSKVTADNFVFGLKDDYFYYSFPTVDYLKYKVSCYRGDEKEYILFDNAVSDIQGSHHGQSTEITEPGDYTLVLKVSKAGYADTVIEAKTPITVKTLDVEDPTGKPKVKYIDGGKTARIWWTPATKADGSNWASANYNVYLVDRENNYTSIISETVKVDILDTIRDSNNVEDKDFYYVDYVLPEGESNLIKNFCVVLSSEDGIEKIEKDKRTCILESVGIEIAEGTGDPTAKYIDEDTACIYWTPAKTSDGKNWPTENYTLYEVNETGFWEKKVLPEGTTITEAIIDGEEVYCVNVEISDTNRGYEFGVQLADGDKKEVAKYGGYLAPRLLDILVDDDGNKYFTGNPQVAYINENTARIWWTPAVKKDKKDWPAENYTVYTIDENGFWTPIKDAKIESTINGGNDVYYFEVKIADTTKKYEFGIELADGDKKETRLPCTLDPKALDIVEEKRTRDLSAEYISEDTVRIWWTPATKKSDESEWAPTNYTVYVKDENGFLDTITDIEVKEDSKEGKVVYYVEYTVEDNEKYYTFEDDKVYYTFEVVLTIDGNYEDVKPVTVPVPTKYKSPETTEFDAENNAKVNFISFDNTDLFANDAVLSITLAEDEKVDFVKYKVLNKSDDFIFPGEALLDSAFVELTVAEEYYGANKFIVKDLKEGDRIVFLYSIVEEDKEPICEITSINVVDTSDVVDTFKDAINDLDDLNDPITILDAYDQADDKKSNVTVSFDLSTSSLKYKDNWKVQIFYAKLANDDNSVKWNEIKVPAFEENAAKDKYVAKTEVVLEIDTKVDFDPFDGDFGHYEDTYAIKYVYTCEGISEPIEEVFTKTFEKERQ